MPEVVIQGRIFIWTETGTEGGYWAFQDARYITATPNSDYPERWSYDGLHVLKNGDHLRVLDKIDGKKEVFSCVVSLAKTPTSVGPFQMHQSPDGIGHPQWDRCFLEEYPAELKIVSP